MPRRHLVVSYDVVDDATRGRLAKYLLGYFDRVQKSVFEGEVDEARRAKLAGDVARLVDREQDSVRFYSLCSRCRAATDVLGIGLYVEPEEGDVVL
jgi:CRISPR-associated protein Cas2